MCVPDFLQVKLSGRADQPSIIWVGKGVLASASGESVVRFVDFTDETDSVCKMGPTLTKGGQGHWEQHEITGGVSVSNFFLIIFFTSRLILGIPK